MSGSIKRRLGPFGLKDARIVRRQLALWSHHGRPGRVRIDVVFPQVFPPREILRSCFLISASMGTLNEHWWALSLFQFRSAFKCCCSFCSFLNRSLQGGYGHCASVSWRLGIIRLVVVDDIRSNTKPSTTLVCFEANLIKGEEEKQRVRASAADMSLEYCSHKSVGSCTLGQTVRTSFVSHCLQTGSIPKLIEDIDRQWVPVFFWMSTAQTLLQPQHPQHYPWHLHLPDLPHPWQLPPYLPHLQPRPRPPAPCCRPGPKASWGKGHGVFEQRLTHVVFFHMWVRLFILRVGSWESIEHRAATKTYSTESPVRFLDPHASSSNQGQILKYRSILAQCFRFSCSILPLSDQPQ